MIFDVGPPCGQASLHRLCGVSRACLQRLEFRCFLSLKLSPCLESIPASFQVDASSQKRSLGRPAALPDGCGPVTKKRWTGPPVSRLPRQGHSESPLGQHHPGSKTSDLAPPPPAHRSPPAHRYLYGSDQRTCINAILMGV